MMDDEGTSKCGKRKNIVWTPVLSIVERSPAKVRRTTGEVEKGKVKPLLQRDRNALELMEKTEHLLVKTSSEHWGVAKNSTFGSLEQKGHVTHPSSASSFPARAPAPAGHSGQKGQRCRRRRVQLQPVLGLAPERDWGCSGLVSWGIGTRQAGQPIKIIRLLVFGTITARRPVRLHPLVGTVVTCLALNCRCLCCRCCLLCLPDRGSGRGTHPTRYKS